MKPSESKRAKRARLRAELKYNLDEIKKIDAQLEELAVLQKAEENEIKKIDSYLAEIDSFTPLNTMKPNRPYENTLTNRVAQFEQDEKRAAAPIKKKSATPKVATDNQNPYLRARLKILADYKEWRRNEIETLEKVGDLNNKHYLSFVKEVAELGDSYAS